MTWIVQLKAGASPSASLFRVLPWWRASRRSLEVHLLWCFVEIGIYRRLA